MKLYSSINKKGSALVIALFFSFCMLILLGALIFRQSNTSSHNKISLSEKQAFFASRSAIQHFLLKAKLFPTELYDAVEISQGKNPLFNFSEFPSRDKNGNDLFEEYVGLSNVYIRKDGESLPDTGKPRYFYIKMPENDSFIRIGSYYNPDYRFLAPNIHKNSQTLKYTEPGKLPDSYKANKYLVYYYRDCTNYPKDNVNLQPLLETVKASNISNINKYDISVEPFGSYPYTLRYQIEDIKVAAIQGMRKYGEEAIEIKVLGEVIDFQNKTKNSPQNIIQKIERTNSQGNLDYD